MIYGVRLKTKNPSAINVIWVSRWHVKNILFFRNCESVYIHGHPVPLEGRIAIVTDAGWDAVDAEGASDEST